MICASSRAPIQARNQLSPLKRMLNLPRINTYKKAGGGALWLTNVSKNKLFPMPSISAAVRVCNSSLLLQRLDRRVHQKLIVKLRHLARAFTQTGNSRAESGLCHFTARLAMSPMMSESCSALISPGRGTVSSPVPHTALNNSAANQSKGVLRSSVAPAVNLPGSAASAGIAGLFYFHVFHCGGDGRRRRQRSTRAHGLRRQIFDCRANRNIFPPAPATDRFPCTPSQYPDRTRPACRSMIKRDSQERIRQPLLRCRQIRRTLNAAATMFADSSAIAN